MRSGGGSGKRPKSSRRKSTQRRAGGDSLEATGPERSGEVLQLSCQGLGEHLGDILVLRRIAVVHERDARKLVGPTDL